MCLLFSRYSVIGYFISELPNIDNHLMTKHEHLSSFLHWLCNSIHIICIQAVMSIAVLYTVRCSLMYDILYIYIM